LTDKLFIVGTTVPGLASNCSTLELLNVRNADRLSARDALRFDRGDKGDARGWPAIRIIQLLQGNENHASSNIEGRGRFEREPPIVSKVPEAQRAMYKTQIDQTRKAWVDMAKNPSTKATMESTCKQTLDATKASLTALGCTF
jgi:hypothetical protein